MPTVTTCSMEAYKSPGFHFNRSSFDENTYSFEEIFHPSTVDSLKKKVCAE